jgi:PAS domain-containing protein
MPLRVRATAAKPKPRRQPSAAPETGRQRQPVCTPVYQNGRSLMNTEERRTAFTGVVTASFRLADILHETLSETEEKEFHLRFFDKDFPDGQSVFMDYTSGLKEAPLFQSAIIFGSHQYVLQAQPSAEYWRTHISWVTWAAIIGGLSFTALFGAHLLMTSAHTHNVENLVRQRTAQLHDSENRLSTILNYAAEAILTCNANGLIQSANPSAENLFGLAPGGMRGRQLLSFFRIRLRKICCASNCHRYCQRNCSYIM